MQITIDGPAGAGKTSTAKAVSHALGFTYLDTGALYRAVALYLKQNDIPVEKASGAIWDIDIEIRKGAIFLNGRDVSDKIRTQEISDLSSRISVIPEIRAALLDVQRDMAENNNIVIEGRDTGSVVLPDADLKFYLTADLLVRAQRRYLDETDKGRCPDPVEIAAQLKERDERDMNRPVAPLIQPDGALCIDNTHFTLQQTVEFMLSIIKALQKQTPGKSRHIPDEGVDGHTKHLQGIYLPIKVNSIVNNGTLLPSDVSEMHIAEINGVTALVITPEIVG